MLYFLRVTSTIYNEEAAFISFLRQIGGFFKLSNYQTKTFGSKIVQYIKLDYRDTEKVFQQEK